MKFIINRLRKLFLLNYTHFFVILFSLSFFSSFVMTRFLNFDKSIFFISGFLFFCFFVFMLKFYKNNFYIDKNILTYSNNKLHVIEYKLLNGDIFRLNSDGSYHNDKFATIERGNKKFFRYKNEFLPFDSLEEFQKIAPIQNKINNF